MLNLRALLAHPFIRLTLLLILVTARVPINSASAETRAFTVPKRVVDDSIWKAVWRNTFDGAQKVETLLYHEFLIQLYKAHPNADPQQAVNLIHDLRQKYEAAVSTGQAASQRPRQDYDDIVRAMFDVAIDVPGLTATVKPAWGVMIDPALSLQLDSATAIAAAAHHYPLPVNLYEREDAILQAALDLAQQTPRFAQAYDQLTNADLKASIQNIDASQLLLAHPTLYVPPRIRDHILPDGSVSISLQELKELSQSEFDQFNATLTDLRATINTIDANQAQFLDYLKDQKKREEMQALAKAKADESKQALDDRKTAFSVISAFIGRSDPKLGKQVNTILTSYGQIGDALDKWLEATAKLKGLDAFANMSTLVMTGNILGAVMNIVSLFGKSEPTPEQMILESIAKLRQQINDLHRDMDRRFDRIDRQLNVIYTTMQDRFNLVDVQLGKLNGNVQEIQRTLVGIELTLSRIERNNYEFLDAAHRRPLLNAINGAIDYQARTGLAMPYQPDFVDHENVFQTWGTLHAFDALSAGPLQRDFNDAQVLAELNAYPLDANINYLNGWLLAHGLTPFANGRLASSRDWTFASRAMTQLALDWPEHINRINPDRQAALDLAGANLAAAVRHISTLDTPTGPQGNMPLFAGLTGYYSGTLAQLDASIQPIETQFVTELRELGLKRTEPFDLFGGIDQPLTYENPEFALMQCGVPESLGFTGISTLKTFVPNIERYMLADYLKLGTFKICLTGDWADTEPQCNPKLGCKFIAKFQITIDVKFDEVSIASRSHKSEFWEETHGDTQSLAVARWKGASLRAAFEANSFGNVPSDELKAQRAGLLAKVTDDLQTQLAQYQQQLYGRIFTALTAGSLRPDAVELAGGKALLDSFITLGLPRAVADDDLLRSLLFGTQRVLDDSLVAETYAISAVQPITQVQTMTNTRVALNQLATQRLDALQGLLDEYLAAIGNTTHVEEFKLVAHARQELRLAQRLAKLTKTTGPTPNGQQVIYLPALQR